MKTKIALVLMLAAAGCSKTAGSECDAPINKGMDNFTQSVKARGSDSPMTTAMLGIVDKLRSTFIQRCHEDKWAPETAACFGKINGQKDVKECEGKLTEEQRKKVTDQVREIMMSSMKNMPGMGGMPGHPQNLQGAPAAAGDSAAKPADGAAPAAGDKPAGEAAKPADGAAPAAGSAAPAAGDKPAGEAAKPAGGGW